jgi:hypothetical protein
MNPFRYKITLRLRHPTMDPRDITKALEMQPQFEWTAGNKRSTPKGEPLKGVNAFTYWCSEGSVGEGFDLPESLSSQLFVLEAHKSFLTDFVSTGGTVEYYIAWFADGLNTGATLDWQLLKRLSVLQIDLALDVYGGKSPSRTSSQGGEVVSTSILEEEITEQSA